MNGHIKKANQLTSFTRVANQKSCNDENFGISFWVIVILKKIYVALVTSFPVSKNPSRVNSSESIVKNHILVVKCVKYCYFEIS